MDCGDAVRDFGGFCGANWAASKCGSLAFPRPCRRNVTVGPGMAPPVSSVTGSKNWNTRCSGWRKRTRYCAKRLLFSRPFSRFESKPLSGNGNPTRFHSPYHAFCKSGAANLQLAAWVTPAEKSRPQKLRRYSRQTSKRFAFILHHKSPQELGGLSCHGVR